VATSPLMSSGPISNTAKPGRADLVVAGVVAFIGGIFALAGSAALISIFLLPTIHIIEAQGWRNVPCTILYTQVAGSGSRNTAYSIDIRFKYTFDNVSYVGTRYNFSGASSEGFAYCQAIVHRLHDGAHTLCYVDPTDPSESVIDRGMFRGLWFGLLPLIFIVIGVSIVVFALRSAHQRPVSTTIAGGAVRVNPSQLKEAQSPLTKLVVIGVIVLFWNGIVSVFVRHAYFTSGAPMVWFIRVFLIPFILIGLLIILAWFHQLLAIFNPRPHLALTNPAIALGESSELRWNFTGNVSRISRLTIRIEGRESATYQRHSSSRNGDSSATDVSAFVQIPITDTTRRMDIGSGRGSFTIAADSMHSFASRNYKIIWSVILHGEISGWPDVKTEFPFNVAPMATKLVHA
jgi:hypothetical protein